MEDKKQDVGLLVMNILEYGKQIQRLDELGGNEEVIKFRFDMAKKKIEDYRKQIRAEVCEEMREKLLARNLNYWNSSKPCDVVLVSDIEKILTELKGE